jgi:hypothetical protein
MSEVKGRRGNLGQPSVVLTLLRLRSQCPKRDESHVVCEVRPRSLHEVYPECNQRGRDDVKKGVHAGGLRIYLARDFSHRL